MDIGVKRRLYGPNKWPLTPVCKDTWQNLQPILLFLPTQSCLLSASRYPREHEHLYPCAEKSHCCSHLKLSRRQPSTPAKEVLNHSYCLLWHRTVTNNSTDIQLVQFVYKNKTFRQSRSGHSHVQLSITYQNANSWQAAFSTTVTDKLFHFCKQVISYYFIFAHGFFWFHESLKGVQFAGSFTPQHVMNAKVQIFILRPKGLIYGWCHPF